MYIALEHTISITSSSPQVAGDVDLLFKVHASVTNKAFYGLNITNSVILNNTGNGVQAWNGRSVGDLRKVVFQIMAPIKGKRIFILSIMETVSLNHIPNVNIFLYL